MKKEEPPTAKGSRNQPTRIPSTNQPRSSQNILIALFKRFYDPIRRTNADFLLPRHTRHYTWACLVPKDIDFASAKRKQNQRRGSSTSVRRAVWQFLPLYLPNPNCVIAPSAIPPFIDPLMDSSLLGIAKWNGFNAVSPRCWHSSRIRSDSSLSLPLSSSHHSSSQLHTASRFEYRTGWPISSRTGFG